MYILWFYFSIVEKRKEKKLLWKSKKYFLDAKCLTDKANRHNTFHHQFYFFEKSSAI
jgi:hypothetical protein